MRTHVLMDRTEDSETWEITWPPGTGLDWHTHGASAAVVSVVTGVLTEWVREETGERGQASATKLIHQAGTIFARDPYTAHKVVNQGRQPAVTLHTYSPPLTVTYTEEQEIW